MDELSKDYIYLDSIWLKEEKLLQMAYSAGCYTIAEHYLNAYLANSLINGRREAIVKVNDVRRSYGVKPIPVPDAETENDVKRRKNTNCSADMARQKYSNMSSDQRKAVLTEALHIILKQHIVLFKTRLYWNGIYLVVKDRVDGKIKKSVFADLAEAITPQDWPLTLKIGKTTLNNYAHYVDYMDQGEAYYDMENNPWKDLCDTFWEILEQQILTSF